MISIVAVVVGGDDRASSSPRTSSLPRAVLQATPTKGTPNKLIFTGPLDAFATRLKIATYGGIVLAMPVWLWQLWRFITPGLNPKEKKYAIPFVLSSIVLFMHGRASSPC